MFGPILLAAVLFGGFYLADKYKSKRLSLRSQMGNLDDEINWKELVIDGQRYLVAPTYIGPMSTGAAWDYVEKHGLVMPTPRMVDAIYQAADLKIAPVTAARMGEDNKGKNAAQYERHRLAVERAINGQPFELLGGSHKDIVFIESAFGKPVNKLGIYGWHKLNGKPIQQEMWGHALNYEDYSQGLRRMRKL